MTPKQSKIAQRIIAGSMAIGLVTIITGIIGEAITGLWIWRSISLIGIGVCGLPLFCALVFVLTMEMLGIKWRHDD